MPHKHRAKRGHAGHDDHDLPPTEIARPLPVGKSPQAAAASKSKASGTGKAKRKAGSKEYRDDDTPKAFLRLMQFHKTGKGLKGLDNGDAPPSKKRKRTGTEAAPPVNANDEPAKPELKIQPGERLADFNARVDQALPVGGLVAKRKATDGIKERQTKHEKKLRKLQAGWREEEARIREREAEERELAEEEEDEHRAVYGDPFAELDHGRKKSRGRGPAGVTPGPGTRRSRKRSGRDRSDDEDPWKQLIAARDVPKGLHDVVQAPPTFKRLPKEKFKVHDGAKANVADIPSAAGSLRRREELGQTRQDIIESYRRLMQEKRKA